MRSTLVACGVAAAALIACSSASEPSTVEAWDADLVATQRVLFMTFTRSGAQLAGSGTLASLTNPATEALVVVGTRTADTVSISYSGPTSGTFRFTGYYDGNGHILGVLDGGPFKALSASFRSQ